MIDAVQHRAIRILRRPSALLILSTAIGLTSCHSRSSATPSPASPRIAAFRATVDSLAAATLASPVSGMSIAVMHGRDTLIWKGYGVEDITTRRPVTPATVFWVASLTKPMAAAAVIRAADAGRLNLDDTVGKWLSDAPIATRGVTIRQMLAMTDGIHNIAAVPDWKNRGAEVLTPRQLVGLVERDTLDFTPGTKWRYSNTAYVLLGMILERATGEPFAEHLSRTMLRPLGMTSSAICDGGRGYERKDGALVPATPLHATRLYAAGALCSNIGDIVKWAQAFQRGDVVSRARVTEMTTVSGPARTAAIKYGLGIASDTLGGHRRFHHPGGVYGFSAHMAMFPDDSLTVVVLMNTGPGYAEPLSERIARAWFGLPLTK